MDFVALLKCLAESCHMRHWAEGPHWELFTQSFHCSEVSPTLGWTYYQGESPAWQQVVMKRDGQVLNVAIQAASPPEAWHPRLL